MATKNDVTGDKIQSKANSQAFRDNWDLIFSKKQADTAAKDGEHSPKPSNLEVLDASKQEKDGSP